jgi:hypothetical protein
LLFPELEVAVKVDTAAPPLLPAVNVTDVEPVPQVAVPIVGACAIVVAVILFDAAEARDCPTAFVAVTVNVYEPDDCNPVTVIGDAAPVPVNPPGDDVTVKVETGAPPLEFGVKVIDAAPLL